MRLDTIRVSSDSVGQFKVACETGRIVSILDARSIFPKLPSFYPVMLGGGPDAGPDDCPWRRSRAVSTTPVVIPSKPFDRGCSNGDEDRCVE